MSNIALFDTAVIYVADKLYEAFPVCINMKTYDEIRKIPWGSHVDEEQKALIFSETLFWLEENGFLNFSGHKGRLQIKDSSPEASVAFSCVRLSVAGLNLLKAPPPSLESKESFGEKISKGLKEAVSKQASSMMAELGTEFMVSLGKQMSGGAG